MNNLSFRSSRDRALLASAPSGVLAVGEDGRIQMANLSAETMFGYGRDELVGLSVEALIPERQRVWHVRNRGDYLGTLAPGPIGQGRDLLGLRKDGTGFLAEIWLSSSGAPVDPQFTCIISDTTERGRAEEKLEYLALHDRLTGLANRPQLLERLTQALARAERHPGSVAVLYLDLDRFKKVNDYFGHEVGDRVLAEVGDRIRKVLRPEDAAARVGGDEFVVLCEGIKSERQVTTIAQRLNRSMAEPILLSTGELVVSTSIGIAVALGWDLPDPLLRAADDALYRAKLRGGDCFEFFDHDMRATSLERMKTEAELHHAIEAGELRLLFQPLVAVDDFRIMRVEALARWEHPRRGLLAPNEFIPLAEETELIWDLGSWVLQEACRQAVLWEHAMPDHRPIPIAVNVAARQLAHPDFEQTVLGILDDTDAEPKNLWLELTETALMDPTPAALETLRRLRDLGIHVAIDDFGTGYSSLSHLKQFKVDELKVDQSFVQGLGRDADDSSIVSAVVNLAHSMGLSATAEGVETAEQAEGLRRLGCDLAQGFYFGRPEPAHRIQELLFQSTLAKRPARKH